MMLSEAAQLWRPEPVEDETTPDAAVGGAAAGLWEDAPPPGAVLPPLWHWFHFLDWPPHGALGGDGHPADGPFLPPIEDRQRMFAGGVCTVHRPLRYDEGVQRRRSMVDVRHKTGRSGELLFVTVRSELTQRGALCIVEDQDIVYRSGAAATDRRGLALATTEPDLPVGAAHLRLHTDPPLLFRMSALTGNLHRIHYDHPYAVGVEHYPGLLVHGPLLVLHMLEVARRRALRPVVEQITYRLRAPVYVGEPLAAVADAPDALRIVSAREPSHATVELRLANSGSARGE